MREAPRLILHVGAPKCGSTALQLALSNQPQFGAPDGRRFDYVALGPGGSLFSGADLSDRARRTSSGSKSSPNFPDAERAAGILDPARPALAAMIAEGRTPILSSEGWVKCAGIFAGNGFLDRLGGGALVVLYVRPPVDWLNSAWWQWGAWLPIPLDNWVRRQVKGPWWVEAAEEWAAVPGVSGVRVELAEDVTTRFFSMLGASAPQAVRANAGVPPAFLQFLRRNRQYRKDAHSPRTEFVVARHLPARRWPTPWVLEPQHIRMAFNNAPDLAEGLRPWLGKADRAALDANRKWWTPDAYADRAVDDLARYETPEALAELVGMLRGGLGDDAAAAEAEAARRIAASPEPVATADAMIAQAVDEMHDRLRGRPKRRARLVGRLLRR